MRPWLWIIYMQTCLIRFSSLMGHPLIYRNISSELICTTHPLSLKDSKPFYRTIFIQMYNVSLNSLLVSKRMQHIFSIWISKLVYKVSILQYCITESYYPKEEKFLPWCRKEYRIAHQNFSFEEPIVVGHNLVQRKYECVLCPQWGTNGVFPSPACKRFYSGMNNNSSKVCKKGPKQLLVSFSSFPIDLVLPIEFFFCFILVEGFKVSYFAIFSFEINS